MPEFRLTTNGYDWRIEMRQKRWFFFGPLVWRQYGYRFDHFGMAKNELHRVRCRYSAWREPTRPSGPPPVPPPGGSSARGTH